MADQGIGPSAPHGDVDCDDDRDAVDALGILRHIVSLPPLQTPPGCAAIGEPLESGSLQGGVLATFDVVGDQYKIWVTNQATIRQIFDLQAGTSTSSIPVGRIHRGPGQADHNAPYSWHIDPEEVEMADAAIEVCDARPSYVEENVDYFVDTVGTYCPWSAQLLELQDFR